MDIHPHMACALGVHSLGAHVSDLAQRLPKMYHTVQPNAATTQPRGWEWG